ncbi:hypothetical protein [Phenylobacterium aquaticum]|uniref:hypothetical protein n=1 Tax=Phenylobacterium aquaticum TaxID=1763816 RepID=UPI0026E9E35C|nr:hypothetical protein [Phenylobacterium aquaticum]
MSEDEHSKRAESADTDQSENGAGHRPVRVIEFQRAQPTPDGSDNAEADGKIAVGVLMVTLCGACSAAVLWNSGPSGGEGASMVWVFGGGPILIGIILILRGIAERNS